MFLVSGRLSRIARTPQARGVHWAALFCLRGGARDASERFFVYVAALEMHPLDMENRVEELAKAKGIGYCNITKCCTKVCPESITITDNAIIPLKERVVDEFYDPIKRLFRRLRR